MFLEHSLTSHLEQVFVKYVCNGLKDAFDIGYSWPQKCEISRSRTSANENPDF